MTPETRAARDRIAAMLDPDTARFPTVDVVPGSRNPTWEDVYVLIVHHDELIRSMLAPDVRTVLAALDQLPDGLITCEHILTEQAAEDLKRRFLAAQHDGVTRILDEPERAACADCARPIQYLDHPGWPTGWMHILEAADHEARPQDNPA